MLLLLLLVLLLATIAKYELALLYSQIGSHHQADVLLHNLGFNFKLNHNITCPQFNIKTQPPTDSLLKKSAMAFDNILPAALFNKLMDCFGQEAEFWKAHEYPTDAFFSYNIKNRKNSNNNSTTGDGETTTMNIVQQVGEFLAPLVDAQFPHLRVSERAESIEFWAHKVRMFCFVL